MDRLQRLAVICWSVQYELSSGHRRPPPLHRPNALASQSGQSRLRRFVTDMQRRAREVSTMNIQLELL